MADSTDLPESEEISAEAVEEALNATLSASLRPVCVGLALFYALLSIWYVTQFEGPARTVLSLSSGLLSLAALAGAVWFERNRIPPRWAHPVTAVIGALVIASCLLPIVAADEPRQTTHLMVALLGFGVLLLSLRWFSVLALLALGGWTLVAGTRAEDPDWYHFGLALFEATLFAALILVVRVRAFRNIERLRLRDQVLMRHLRTANEEVLVAMQAKSSFLANMSHEIRTPMTAMLGMTELLQMTDLTDTQKEFTDTVARSGNTLLQLVNDILDFSKIEAGQLSIENVSFDLRDVLKEAQSMLQFRADQKTLELKVEVSAGVPARFRGDPTRIQQILVNLTGNAIKFTHEGGVTLVAKGTDTGDGRWIMEISVVDTGIGIVPEHLDHIFEAFTQADSSTTRRFGGTGLGLAISSQLARLMGGELNVKSKQDEGSSFSLTLPLEVSGARSRLPEPIIEDDGRRYDGRILLVEDNADNQGLATQMLESVGLQVELVDDGEEAIRLLEKVSYDLVLMDCQMPNLNGYDATREVRLREREGEHQIIVALTASVLPEERARCIEVGMDDYVSKPFSKQDLLAVLQRWLSHKATDA